MIAFTFAIVADTVTGVAVVTLVVGLVDTGFVVTGFVVAGFVVTGFVVTGFVVAGFELVCLGVVATVGFTTVAVLVRFGCVWAGLIVEDDCCVADLAGTVTVVVCLQVTAGPI